MNRRSNPALTVRNEGVKVSTSGVELAGNFKTRVGLGFLWSQRAFGGLLSHSDRLASVKETLFVNNSDSCHPEGSAQDMGLGDTVTFHGSSHPICAPRFLGVNSNVNRRRVHEQDDSQVDGNVSSSCFLCGFCAVQRYHETGQDEKRRHEERRQHETPPHHEARRQHEAELARSCVRQVRLQGSWCRQYHRLP